MLQIGGKELMQKVAEGEGVPFDLQLQIAAFLAPVFIVLTLVFVRFVDRKPIYEIGAIWPPGRTKEAPLHLALAGLGAVIVLGAWRVLVGVVATFKVTPGEEAVEVSALRPEILFFALGFVSAAILEEWVLRGYIFSALREQLPWVHAGGVAALLSVLVSVPRPGSSATGLVNGFLFAMVLAAMRELTGSLWPGVLFAATWKTFMGSVLSLPINGVIVPRLENIEVDGPDAFVGGGHGPQGSWLLAALLALTLIVLAGRLAVDEVVEEEDEDDGDDFF